MTADAAPSTDDDVPLALRQVSKAFGGTTAVDAVDLSLAESEVVVLVGPSGCGKSTLLRLVAGLLPIDAGEVAVGGAVVDDGRRRLPPERRDVGLVFQDHNLFPHLTLGANAAFGMRHVPRSRRRDDAAAMLAMVGVEHLADRYPHEVSGGERQRAALARALGPRPRLLLLDEPFASLDAHLRAQVRSDVVALLRTTATPAIFVSHDRAEALALGHRIAVMRAGRIEQVGAPQQVHDAPANRFVAGFMGDASFLPVEETSAGAVTELGPVGPAHGSPGPKVAVIRPTDVVFVPAGDGTAEVVSAEYQGPTWAYELRLASGAVVRSVRLRSSPVTPGNRVDPSLIEGHHVVVVPDAPGP